MKKGYLLLVLSILSSCSIKSQTVCAPIELKQNAVSFIKWYLQRRQKPEYLFEVLKKWDTLDKSTKKICRINFSEVEKYLIFLKSSGLISDSYIKSILNYRKLQDSFFVKYRQSEEEAVGFDFDLVLQRMEIPDDDDKRLENPEIKNFEMTDTVSKIELHFLNTLFLMKFKFEKCENKWLISQINEPLVTKLEYYPNVTHSAKKDKPKPVRIAFRVVNGKREMIILKNKSKPVLNEKKKREAH